MKSKEVNRIEMWAGWLANGDEKYSNTVSANEVDEFNDYKETWKILEEMQEIEQFDTDKAWDKLYDKIARDDKELNTRILRMNKSRLIAIAASVVILLGIGGYLLFNVGSSMIFRFSNEGLAAKEILLPDGSRVYLNSGAEINYNENFGESKRDINLVGEAFFEVAKDKTKPFVVHTGNTFIRVVGTSFNINSLNEKVEVVVRTGKVEVYTNSPATEHVFLEPGDQAVVGNSAPIVKTVNVNENYSSWKDQKLVFKALPLSNVISDIEKTYHCSIELTDPSVGNKRITTTFDNDSLEDVLHSIALPFNLTVEKDGKKYILASN